MNKIPTVAGAVLIAAMLAACSPGINTFGNSITFDSNGIVVHAAGHPSAHVDRNGVLSIDGKVIAVTPEQRQLLQRYYQQAHATMESGKAMGKQGVQVATHSIGAAIRSIFQGNSSSLDERMDAQSQHIEAAATKLCADVKALRTTQNAIAAELPAFAPYASGDQMECTVTHGNRNDAKSSSFTFALREDSGRGDAATDATSAHTSRPDESNASNSSQP
jgi:hypothetical protein